MRQLPGTVPVSAILTEETFDVADALARFSVSAKGAGAIVSFQGITRPETKCGEPLDRLVLEWHPRLTEISLHQIAQAGADRFAARAVTVVHRCGVILSGETIVLVAVASDHRRHGFLAADYIMDRLKTDAVFWKREEGAFGSRWIEPTQRDQHDRTRWNHVDMYNSARRPFYYPHWGRKVVSMNSDQREIQHKLRVLEHADKIGDVSKTCRYFGIGRASFYRWRKAYADKGEAGLLVARSVPHNHPNKMSAEVEEKILHLRRKYHLGPIRIVWYLERYHAIKVSDAGVYRTLKRHGLNCLPRGTRLRKVHTQRYKKQVPGHHIQMDVKFLIFKGKQGQKVKRYQYTAIDDATRVRALKVYKRHTQAIDFVNHIVEKFPFRIQQIRTDNGHEFQAKFHWHVEDKGIRHVYIKPSSPQLNGKVERSHRSDQQEFYQLLSYKDDVDLEEKLDEWERFYNFARPHGAFNGKTPYEALRERL